VHEAGDGVGFGGVVGYPRVIESFRNVFVAAYPDREYRFRQKAFLPMLLGRGDHRVRSIAGRGQRGWDIHDQNGVVRVIFEQIHKRHGVALRVGIAGNVDGIGARPDRRQRGIERLHRRRRNLGQCAAEIGQTIDSEHADAAAIGQNRQAVSGERGYMTQRFGGGEQFVEIKCANEAGTANRGIIDGVRSGERAGMRHRRLGAGGVASGFDNQHRFGARRSARRRHEFTRVLDRLDVEQNRARAAVKGEVIEQVGKIDIDAVADRDNRGETNAVQRGPFHESGRDRA